MRGMSLELMERRYGETSTVSCTQHPQEDWHRRLGSGVYAGAIVDRITPTGTGSSPAAITCVSTPPSPPPDARQREPAAPRHTGTGSLAGDRWL